MSETSETSKEEHFYHDYRGEALAPMVRASTIPLRTLALKYGADFCYTEELVDRSIGDTLRVENKELGTIDYVKDTAKLAPKVIRRLQREGGPPLLLRIDPKREQGRLVCQLGSGEPELALQAALHVHRDVASIDLNMGWYVIVLKGLKVICRNDICADFLDFYYSIQFIVLKNLASRGAWDRPS